MAELLKLNQILFQLIKAFIDFSNTHPLMILLLIKILHLYKDFVFDIHRSFQYILHKIQGLRRSLHFEREYLPGIIQKKPS